MAGRHERAGQQRISTGSALSHGGPRTTPCSSAQWGSACFMIAMRALVTARCSAHSERSAAGPAGAQASMSHAEPRIASRVNSQAGAGVKKICELRCMGFKREGGEGGSSSSSLRHCAPHAA